MTNPQLEATISYRFDPPVAYGLIVGCWIETVIFNESKIRWELEAGIQNSQSLLSASSSSTIASLSDSQLSIDCGLRLYSFLLVGCVTASCVESSIIKPDNIVGDLSCMEGVQYRSRQSNIFRFFIYTMHHQNLVDQRRLAAPFF